LPIVRLQPIIDIMKFRITGLSSVIFYDLSARPKSVGELPLLSFVFPLTLRHKEGLLVAQKRVNVCKRRALPSRLPI